MAKNKSKASAENGGSRSQQRVVRLARKYLHCAVVIIWHDHESDWNHFRIELVEGNKIALTGMTDAEGIKHTGDFFWVNANEIMKLELRA